MNYVFPKLTFCFPQIKVFADLAIHYQLVYRNSKPRGPAHAWYHFKYNGSSKSVDSVGFVCDALVLAVGILS